MAFETSIKIDENTPLIPSVDKPNYTLYVILALYYILALSVVPPCYDLTYIEASTRFKQGWFLSHFAAVASSVIIYIAMVVPGTSFIKEFNTHRILINIGNLFLSSIVYIPMTQFMYLFYIKHFGLWWSILLSLGTFFSGSIGWAGVPTIIYTRYRDLMLGKYRLDKSTTGIISSLVGLVGISIGLTSSLYHFMFGYEMGMSLLSPYIDNIVILYIFVSILILVRFLFSCLYSLITGYDIFKRTCLSIIGIKTTLKEYKLYEIAGNTVILIILIITTIEASSFRVALTTNYNTGILWLDICIALSTLISFSVSGMWCFLSIVDYARSIMSKIK